MRYFGVFLIGFSLLFGHGSASAQAKASKVFLLEDAGKIQWCSYTTESTWKARVQAVGAMTVGALTYSNDHLSHIDMTETDESGDWTVYDHYFFDDHERLVRLSRVLNVLPGDISVSQTFSIDDGKAMKISTTEKQLSTGKLVTSLPYWLPEVPIETTTKMFPFSGLLGHPGFRTASKSCVRYLATKNRPYDER